MSTNVWLNISRSSKSTSYHRYTLIEWYSNMMNKVGFIHRGMQQRQEKGIVYTRYSLVIVSLNSVYLL